MSQFTEVRMTRRPFEHVLLVLDGKGVMAELSDGLSQRMEEASMYTLEEASTFFDQCVVEAMLRGFTKDG